MIRPAPERELVLDPALPIIDAHHHLWFVPPAELAAMRLDGGEAIRALGRIYEKRPRYLFDDYLADVAAGHNIRASVYVQVHAMYRRDGPEEMRSVGEIEFANGMAAMAASGAFGDARICAAIVGGVDLRLGDRVRPVLEAQIAAGGGRYRGIRPMATAHDRSLPDFDVALGSVAGALADPTFRAGLRHVAELGLSFDIWVLEAQVPELTAFARAFPDLTIILNHLGSPVGYGAHADHRARFPIWRAAIRELASCANVAVKLGGLGNGICGLPSTVRGGGADSVELAAEWGPYIETAIETFGADRCMFESNFPVDDATADFVAVWNAFKRIAAGYSAEERAALFAGTAARIYRIAPGDGGSF